MNERKKLKKQLAEKYIFKMYLLVNEVKKLFSENPKDKPESEERICYDTLSDEIRLSTRSVEQAMFDILNREVKEYGLSYTECNFEVINGKSIKAE